MSSETTHSLATVASCYCYWCLTSLNIAQMISDMTVASARAACFYNPGLLIRACAMQYAFDAFINSEFGSRLKYGNYTVNLRESILTKQKKYHDNNICIILWIYVVLALRKLHNVFYAKTVTVS